MRAAHLPSSQDRAAGGTARRYSRKERRSGEALRARRRRCATRLRRSHLTWRRRRPGTFSTSLLNALCAWIAGLTSRMVLCASWRVATPCANLASEHGRSGRTSVLVPFARNPCSSYRVRGQFVAGAEGTRGVPPSSGGLLRYCTQVADENAGGARIAGNVSSSAGRGDERVTHRVTNASISGVEDWFLRRAHEQQTTPALGVSRHL